MCEVMDLALKSKLEQLFNAVRQGNCFVSRALLKGIIMPMRWSFREAIGANFKLEEVMDIVRLAIGNGCPDIAVDLINLTDGKILMNHALHRNSEEDVRLLLDHGVLVNTRFSNGETFLHRAVILEQESITKLLLERGAEVDAIDHMTETPLLGAAMRTNFNITRLLLDHGADISAVDEKGYNALHFTIYEGNKSRVDYAKLLIERGIDMEAISEESTPLMLAVKEEDDNMVRVLVEGGAQISAKANRHNSVFHAATKRSLVDYIQLFINHGANINDESRFGLTPLHLACRHAKTFMIEFLLQNGADINAQRGSILTPIYQTSLRRSRKKSSQIHRILVSHLAKLVFERKKISNFNITYLFDHPNLLKLLEQCIRELKRMKREKIYYDISLYHILSISTDKFLLLLRNKNFARKFQKPAYEMYSLNKNFPNYVEDLHDKFDDVAYEYDRMSTLKKESNYMFGSSSDSIKERILHHLAKDMNFKVTCLHKRRTG